MAARPSLLARAERNVARMMVHVGVLGGAGYIGSHIVAEGRSLGVPISAVTTPRVEGLPPGPVPDAADQWRLANKDAFTRFCRALEPFDVVINAAGSASPRSDDLVRLFAANAVLPAIAAQAAAAAGVRRVVHVSTAAVQGRLDPLDESCRFQPLSPYARTKSQGEQFLLDAHRHPGPSGGLPQEVIVYRPTSVHGRSHEATKALARLVARLPVVPVVGTGDQQLPVALIQNVASGIMFAATMVAPAPIILQPAESITTRLLLELFGARRVLRLPPGMPDFMLTRLATVTAGRPSVESRLRWLEILLRGQRVQADALATAGFKPAVDLDGWRALAQELTVADREPAR